MAAKKKVTKRKPAKKTTTQSTVNLGDTTGTVSTVSTTIAASTSDIKPQSYIDGKYWVWPNGTKTHLRFILKAVQQMRPLPKDFYKVAEKLDRPNLNQIVRKAKSLKLKCTVEKPE